MSNSFGGSEKTIDIMKNSLKEIENEVNIINNSMNVLKQWSNKNTSNVIFDSDIDGNGNKNVLHDKVLNKSNLYFIHFDSDNNVCGGYISTKIDKSDGWIFDKNSFVFSLIRNGKVNNKRYFLKQNTSRAFILFNDHPGDQLYQFGNDIIVWNVGIDRSCCTDNFNYCWYDYKNDKKPLSDTTSPPDRFVVQRIVVVEMN
ncbi:TLDc domain-containing protein [Entamoeba marina]